MVFILSEELDAYIEAHTTPVSASLQQLERETYLKVLMPRMLSGKVQGKVLESLSRMIKPRRILEIGTYTGYSAICLAKGLASGGELITIDMNEELTSMAAAAIEKEGLTSHIRLVLGNALEVVPTLDGPFDLVFIDADKKNYIKYLDMIYPKVRNDGWILADNVLWSGKVVQPDADGDTKAIQEFNAYVQVHPGLDNVILSVRDGILIARKSGITTV